MAFDVAIGQHQKPVDTCSILPSHTDSEANSLINSGRVRAFVGCDEVVAP